MRRLAAPAAALLPVAALGACTGVEQGTATAAGRPSPAANAHAAPPGVIDDVCAVLTASDVQQVLGGGPVEVVPSDADTSRFACCCYSTDGRIRVLTRLRAGFLATGDHGVSIAFDSGGGQPAGVTVTGEITAEQAGALARRIAVNVT
jgi:hypothetical protein